MTGSTSEAGAPQGLDERFGVAVPPHRVSPLEQRIKPLSCQQLDEASANLLKRMMGAVHDGLGVGQHVYSYVPILWVVDERGVIWFAVEEVIDGNTSEVLMPKAKKADLPAGAEKLGHPALIAGGPGRIAGEILYDGNYDPPGWMITNGSGRYGTISSRTEAHLKNAADEFDSFGIEFRYDFY